MKLLVVVVVVVEEEEEGMVATHQENRLLLGIFLCVRMEDLPTPLFRSMWAEGGREKNVKITRVQWGKTS